MKTITVIVRETSSPLPPVYKDILIYSLMVDDPENEDTVLDAVANLRCTDLDCHQYFDEVRAGLSLQVAFKGDVDPIVDYRKA